MNSIRPPVVASWLLERLISGAKREALAGDLAEQFAVRRSGAWYWRQVLGAVVLDMAEDIRQHKLLAVRAMVLGWGILWLGMRAVFPVCNMISDIGGTWANNWMLEAGWDTVRTYWGQFQINLLPYFVGWWIVGKASGAMVTRFHRGHESAFLCLLAMSAVLFVPAPIWWLLREATLTRSAFLRASAVSQLVAWLMASLVMVLCILSGALRAPDSGSRVEGRM